LKGCYGAPIVRLQFFNTIYDLSHELSNFFSTKWFVLWDCKIFQYDM